MADYWVSQEKKYCDFCNCWIANNKPSVEFHEKGRRHQQNVKKKLRNITKASARTQRETERVDLTIKQIEKAALEAYRKDIDNEADFSSREINEKIKKDNLEIREPPKLWHQLKSKQGQIYYWNTMTNETSWEKPKEGFLTLAEQKDLSLKKTQNEINAVEREKRKEALLRMQEQQQQDMEDRARKAREKMKERRVADDPIPTVSSGPILEPGYPHPYGRWETVKEVEYQDYELPQQEYYELPAVVSEPEPPPPVKEFKEKVVESLEGTFGEATFKKRKFNFASKKNARQRLGD